MKVLLSIIAVLTTFSAFAGDPVEGVWRRTNLDAADPLTPYVQEYLSFGAGAADSYYMVAQQTARKSGTYTMTDSVHVLVELQGADAVEYRVDRSDNPAVLSLCVAAGCRTYEAVARVPDYDDGSHAVPTVVFAITLSCDAMSRPTVVRAPLLPTLYSSTGTRIYMPITSSCGDFGMTMDFTLLGANPKEVESYATIARLWRRGPAGEWLPTQHALTLNFLALGKYVDTTIPFEGRVFGTKIKAARALL